MKNQPALRLSEIKISQIFNPIGLLILSIGGNLLFQMYGLAEAWSPFQVLGVDFDPSIIGVVLTSILGILFGSICTKIFTLGHTPNKQAIHLNRFKIIELAKAFSLLLVIALLATQASLGSANVINLWRGMATPKDVEDAIQQSAFGIHGISLLIAFTGVMIWHAGRISDTKHPWISTCAALSAIFFLSQGKAQGLVYVAAAYLVEPRSTKKTLLSILSAAGLIAAVFLVTRVARNQESDLTISTETLLLMALGLYFGSPIANTCYILQKRLETGHETAFLSHLIPEKILARSDLFDQLPDPTSPLGLVGASLVLGGAIQVFFFSTAIGALSSLLYKKTQESLSLRIFFPFLTVACLFSMMYNHFANLTFFWIPIIIARLVANSISTTASPHK